MVKMKVQNIEITVLTNSERGYVSLTDMADTKGSESRAADIVKNCIRQPLYNRIIVFVFLIWVLI